MPAARPGSPWQRRAGLRPLFATWWEVLRRPRAVWSEVGVLPRPAASLLLATLTAAALLPALALMIPSRKWGTTSGVYTLANFFGVWFVMLALTSVEFTGIRFFGARRGWRITPAVALVICAHAATGWLVGGAGVALAWLVGANTLLVSDTVLWALIAAFFLGGMCLYSLLAGAGFHALRFVNDPAAIARRSAGAPKPVEQGPAPASAGRDP